MFGEDVDGREETIANVTFEIVARSGDVNARVPVELSAGGERGVTVGAFERGRE